MPKARQQAAVAALLPHLLAPVLQLEVPAHRCCQTLLNVVARLPAQLRADAGGIKRAWGAPPGSKSLEACVAQVVAYLIQAPIILET